MSALSLTITFDGHRVRMVGTPERPEWIAKDVCRALYIHNSGQALSNVVPDDERGLTICDTPGGPQQMATVTEPGLYRLILRSRKPAAERFRTWMVRDVIPCIRKYGCYPTPPQPALPATREQQIAVALLLAQQVIEEKDTVIAEMKPKAATFDACMSSRDMLTVAQVANILHRPSRPLGEIRLFRRMREWGMLQRDNRPYQEHVDAGRLKARETALTYGADGTPHIHLQPLVTQKGVDYIRQRLDAEDGQQSLLPARRPAGGLLPTPVSH